MKLKCPYHSVEIPDDREVVVCDDLKFPWRQDPKGYFLVKIEDGMLKCGFVNMKHVMETEFQGKTADKIIKEIAKRELCNLEHMGYIASELERAQHALESKTEFIQR